jgi:hypothetical protein
VTLLVIEQLKPLNMTNPADTSSFRQVSGDPRLRQVFEISLSQRLADYFADKCGPPVKWVESGVAGWSNPPLCVRVSGGFRGGNVVVLMLISFCLKPGSQPGFLFLLSQNLYAAFAKYLIALAFSVRESLL